MCGLRVEVETETALRRPFHSAWSIAVDVDAAFSFGIESVVGGFALFDRHMDSAKWMLFTSESADYGLPGKRGRESSSQ